MKSKKPFRMAGLFAGIGGFERAFELEGAKTVLLCEKDPVARHVLQARFPNIPAGGMCEDVMDVQSLPSEANVVCAGFPCQDLSSVGDKRGIRGSQSYLVDEVFRLLENADPDWVIIENVMFMLHLGKGAAMRFITENFERLGFKWAYRLIDSHAFGVPQRRRRVFFVASRRHDPCGVLLNPEKRPVLFDPDIDKPIGFYWTEGKFARGLADDSVPPLKGGSSLGIPSPPAVMLPGGLVVVPSIEDAEKIQGFPRGWTKPAEEIARPSARWKLVGNAVTVNAARWLAKRLSSGEETARFQSTPIHRGASWPKAAWGGDGKRYSVTRNDHPACRKAPSLVDLLSHPRKPLSEKATLGFLARARSGNLNYPMGFLEALDRHADKMAGVP